MQLLHALEPAIVIGIVGDEIIVDDVPIARADALMALVRRLQQSGVERVTIDRGATLDELSAFVGAVTRLEPRREAEEETAFPALKHIRVGRVHVEQRVEASMADMAALRRLYKESVTVAETV